MLVSISHLSDLTGFDRRTIGARLKDLEYVDGKGNKGKQYQSKQALRTLYGGINGDLDPQQEKAQLDRVRREVAELDRDKKRGLLVDAEEVAAEWRAMIGAVRSGVLAVASRVAPELVLLTDERKIEDAIAATIHEAMEAISESD